MKMLSNLDTLGNTFPGVKVSWADREKISRWLLCFVSQLHKQLPVRPSVNACALEWSHSAAHRSHGISSCGVSCCSSAWTWCCTSRTWRASFQCVWPCGPAGRSSGWRPCRTDYTWRDAPLHQHRDPQLVFIGCNQSFDTLLLNHTRNNCDMGWYTFNYCRLKHPFLRLLDGIKLTEGDTNTSCSRFGCT